MSREEGHVTEEWVGLGLGRLTWNIKRTVTEQKSCISYY